MTVEARKIREKKTGLSLEIHLLKLSYGILTEKGALSPTARSQSGNETNLWFLLFYALIA